MRLPAPGGGRGVVVGGWGLNKCFQVLDKLNYKRTMGTILLR